MKRFPFLRGRRIVALAAVVGGTVLAHPPAPPGPGGLPVRIQKHGVPVKPPLTPAPTATVIRVDPVPNTEDPATGAPLHGGIRYTWTVNLAGNTSAAFDGVAGAWGWDEDGDPLTTGGRSEAAHWVALHLKSPSLVTIHIARKAQVPDPFATFPGAAGGPNLIPAFTLYSGWDGDGGNEATFSNRGSISWAEDLRYLGHVESPGTAVERTFTLAAGLYSIVLGGNPTSLLPESRQGYTARLVSVSLEKAPRLMIRGGGKQTASRASATLSGRAGNPGEISNLRVLYHGRNRVVKVRAASWRIPITGLERGSNVVWISPVSKYGTVFPAQRVVIRRG